MTEFNWDTKSLTKGTENGKNFNKKIDKAVDRKEFMEKVELLWETSRNILGSADKRLGCIALFRK